MRNKPVSLWSPDGPSGTTHKLDASVRRGYLKRGPDGALRVVHIADPWSAPALATIDLPVYDPARCRAGIVAWLAYPQIGKERKRKNAAAALLAETWLEAFRAGKLTIGGKPAKRKDIPYADTRRRDRERRIERTFALANQRLADVQRFLWPQIVEGLSGGAGRLGFVEVSEPRSVLGIASALAAQEKPVHDLRESADNLRQRRWRDVRHVAHLADAIIQAGDMPVDEAGLVALLEDAESRRLLALPALGAPVYATESLQFHPKRRR